MFRSKKNRDSALLAFMGLIVLLFILYVIFPPGGKDKKDDEPHLNSPDKSIAISTKAPGDIHIPDDIYEPLREELKKTFTLISSGQTEINLLPVEKLTSELVLLIERSGSCPADKLLRYSFRDLSLISKENCLSKNGQNEKFDIYTALFLIRVNKEDIFNRSFNTSITETLKQINFSPYNIIGNEVEENYRLLPAMIFSTMMINSMDIFENPGISNEFLASLERIKDLTESQLLNSLKDLMGFSKEKKKYTISWIEHDPIDPDDKGKYKNVLIINYTFFKHDFFLLPDNSNPPANIWIKELTESDGGSIELKDLKISEEVPGEGMSARTVFYSPKTTRFIVVMDSPKWEPGSAFILKLYREKMEEIRRNYKSINFSEKITAEKEFRDKLLEFGKYIYRIRGTIKTSDHP